MGKNAVLWSFCGKQYKIWPRLLFTTSRKSHTGFVEHRQHQGRSQKLHVEGGAGARGLLLLLSVCSLLRSYPAPSPYFLSKINKYIRSIGEIFKRFRMYTTSQPYSVLLQETLIFCLCSLGGARPPAPPPLWLRPWTTLVGNRTRASSSIDNTE